MKIIVTGATGFTGREVVRQALADPKISSVVAVARKPVSFTEPEILPGSDVSKLVNATIKDYGEYPPDVMAQFAGANACIWTVGITPMKVKCYDWAEVVRVCQTCTIQGFTAMLEAGVAADEQTPFRFVYMSGMGAEPDQTKKPWFSPQYLLMRGETEYKVHSLPAKLPAAAGKTVAAVACRFALISSGGVSGAVLGTITKGVTGWPTLTVVEAAKVLIDQAVNGFYEGKGTLMADDLAKIVKNISAKQ